jgi:hypothetical protein
MINYRIKQLKGVFVEFIIPPLKRLVFGEKKLTDLNSIQTFINRRTAHITQDTLYGYLQTRMGTSYVNFFTDPKFSVSIDTARWNIFVIGVQDIIFYIFSYLNKHQGYQKLEEAKKIYNAILLNEKQNGLSDDLFNSAINEFEKRFNQVQWLTFHQSKPFDKSVHALVQWAPIADELKELDKEIVMNSMILKWNNVGRDFQKLVQKID